MAFIENDDDKELDPNNPAGQVGGGSQAAGGSQGASSAGVGPGGTGGWTNIQAYLNANQGDTGSSQLLGKAVGDQFGQERQNFQGDSSNFLSNAQSTADQNKISNDQANGYIDQAAKQYNYAGAEPNGQEADYSGIVSKFQKALNDPYSGPTEYNYGFGDKTQQYAGDLKDNSGFDTLMSGLYSKAAGSPLSSGQYDLQKQFDVNNKSLGDTRNSLSDQYAQLTADRDKTVGDTTLGLSNIEQDYRQGQNGLRDYLGGKSSAEGKSIGDQENAARNSYNTDYTTNQSGLSGLGQNYVHRLDGQVQDSEAQPFRNEGIWGPMSWERVNHEQDLAKQGWDFNVLARGQSPALADRRNQLNQFYQSENDKYSGTGDQDKRAYNAIQDFLNSTGPRKTAGFQVKG